LSWGQRIHQLAVRLWATPPRDDALARQVLRDDELQLYLRMSAGDQRHAQRVLLALRREGSWSRDVEQAALLHDVGKSQASLTLAHRVAVVLLAAVAPRMLERLAATDVSRWRRPFYAHVHHAEIGAVLCAQAGCSPICVTLVRVHQGSHMDALSPELQAALVALRRADERA